MQPFVCQKIPFICVDTALEAPFVCLKRPLVVNRHFNGKIRICQSGFTLIELLITLVVVAILGFVGIPALQQMLESNRTTVAINDLLADMNLARTEAIKRKGISVAGVAGQVVLCVSRNGTDCTGAPDTWGNGWILFWDQNRSGTFAAADNDVMIKAHGPLPPSIAVTTIPPDIRLTSYDPIGAALGGLASIQITNTRINRVRLLCLNTLGQVSVRPNCA